MLQTPVSVTMMLTRWKTRTKETRQTQTNNLPAYLLKRTAQKPRPHLYVMVCKKANLWIMTITMLTQLVLTLSIRVQLSHLRQVKARPTTSQLLLRNRVQTRQCSRARATIARWWLRLALGTWTALKEVLILLTRSRRHPVVSLHSTKHNTWTCASTLDLLYVLIGLWSHRNWATLDGMAFFYIAVSSL